MRVVGSTEIRVISPVDTTNDGPKVPEGAKGWQPVHLRQGSMDGACGLYSLMMGLIICGVVRYDDARGFYNFTSKSKFGKLFEYFGQLGPLVKDGTSSDQICTAIDDYYQKQIVYQLPKSKEPDLINFIDKHIKKNHPVLLIIAYEGGAHWVLVIGRECERQGNRTELCRFLILDPSEYTPQICSWNGVITLKKQKGEYPYRWWTSSDIDVQLWDAIAIWPKKDR